VPDPDPPPARESVTRALAELSSGRPDAERELLGLVYDELRRLAGARMRNQDEGHTLQPTALVHEAYLRLLGKPDATPSFPDRRHFYSCAAAAMRSILVDHARRAAADKRGGGQRRVTWNPDLAAGELEDDVLLVNDALALFATQYPRQAQVIELLFFAGLSVPEAAAMLDVSERTVKRDWRFGKSWMLARMRPESR